MCSPVAVFHHEVDRRRRVQYLVESDDVGMSDPFENFYFAADSLDIGDGLYATLFQNLSITYTVLLCDVDTSRLVASF